MPDKFSPDVRSRIMSKIRSKWTKPEKKLHGILKGNKIKHLMHPNLPGSPDALLKNFNAIVFVDGCFWHNCPTHGHVPEHNKEYWMPKIARNVARDEKNTRLLKESGYLVIRLWECEVMCKGFSGKSIKEKLSDSSLNDNQGEGRMKKHLTFKPVEVAINSSPVRSVVKNGITLFSFNDLGQAFGLRLRSRPMQLQMKSYERKNCVYSIELVRLSKKVRFLEYRTFRKIVENALPEDVKNGEYSQEFAEESLEKIRRHSPQFEGQD